MKFTFSWLKDHLDTTAALDEVAVTLTRIGLEVEGVEDRSAPLPPFVVGELEAAGLGALKPIDTTPVPAAFKATGAIVIETPQACPIFLGRAIKDVKNGPSPAWLQARLTAIGLRPISALVDITNYFTF